MAREESDREDLLREATALVERIQLAPVHADGEHVTAGFRKGGELTVFFGADPVYQFNAAGELRRAYCDGLLIKAHNGRLASLRRERQPGAVQLLRHDLSDAEQTSILSRMTEKLRDFSARLERGDYHVVGEVPPDANVRGRLQNWLVKYHDPAVARSPRVQ
jgi:hypothetical protein